MVKIGHQIGRKSGRETGKKGEKRGKKEKRNCRKRMYRRRLRSVSPSKKEKSKRNGFYTFLTFLSKVTNKLSNKISTKSGLKISKKWKIQMAKSAKSGSRFTRRKFWCGKSATRSKSSKWSKTATAWSSAFLAAKTRWRCCTRCCSTDTSRDTPCEFLIFIFVDFNRLIRPIWLFLKFLQSWNLITSLSEYFKDDILSRCMIRATLIWTTIVEICVTSYKTMLFRVAAFLFTPILKLVLSTLNDPVFALSEERHERFLLTSFSGKWTSRSAR